MHYILRPLEEKYPWIILKTKINNLSWIDGKKFSDSVPPLVFDIDEGEPFEWCDYLRPNANIPLHSDQFRKALQSVGVSNIDYYPAKIANNVSGESRDYYAANIIGLVRGVDIERSDFDLFDENHYLIENFRRLYLDETKLKGVKICRLAEFPLLTIVDESIKLKLETMGFKGLEFIVPEKWKCFTA